MLWNSSCFSSLLSPYSERACVRLCERASDFSLQNRRTHAQDQGNTLLLNWVFASGPSKLLCQNGHNYCIRIQQQLYKKEDARRCRILQARRIECNPKKKKKHCISAVQLGLLKQEAVDLGDYCCSSEFLLPCTPPLRDSQKASGLPKKTLQLQSPRTKNPMKDANFGSLEARFLSQWERERGLFFLSLRCLCERKTGEENATRTRGTGAAHRARAREREGMQIPDGKGCRFQREARQVLDGKRCRFQRGRKQIPKWNGHWFQRERDADSKGKVL